MPFKSKAQMRKLFALAGEGKISMGKVREWAHKTRNIARLPEKKAAAKMPLPMKQRLSQINKYLKSKGVVTGGKPPTIRERTGMKGVTLPKPPGASGKQQIYS